MITQSELQAYLHYDPETGAFTVDGFLVGHIAKGYLAITIGDRKYAAHRLAWLYVYGYWPRQQLDHINGVTTDNRIANLREVTPSQNSQNRKTPRTNTSGFKGVFFERGSNHAAKPWRAGVKMNGRRQWLGYFSTAEEASAAYEARASELFGQYKREYPQGHRRGGSSAGACALRGQHTSSFS